MIPAMLRKIDDKHYKEKPSFSVEKMLKPGISIDKPGLLNSINQVLRKNKVFCSHLSNIWYEDSEFLNIFLRKALTTGIHNDI